VPAELAETPPRFGTSLPMEILLPSGVKLAVHTPFQMNMAATLIRELSRSC
jgi:hypothetical protein